MSLIDKFSCSAGGFDPLQDSSVPNWKKDLILKKRAMNRTFPLLVSSAREIPRAKYAVYGAEEETSLPLSHAWRSTESSRASNPKRVLSEQQNAMIGENDSEPDATHAFHCSCDKNMVEERATVNDDAGMDRMESTADSESTSPSLFCGSQQSLIYEAESSSDNEAEYEYGPGIVNRLRSKFISLTLRDAPIGPTTPPPPLPTFLPIRRVASMEHLLDEPFYPGSIPRRSADWNKAAPCMQRRTSVMPRSNAEVLKRARSMETLSAIDRGPPGGHSFFPRFLFRGYSREAALPNGPPLSPVNDNVIIIEQPKPPPSPCPPTSGLRLAKDAVRRGTSLTLLDDDEFPKPDTVRTCKKIFEHSEEAAPGGPTVKRKVTPPPKPPGLKPGPKPSVAARRIPSPARAKPVFKLLEQEISEERAVSPTGTVVAATVANCCTNGVADETDGILEDRRSPTDCGERRSPVCPQGDAFDLGAKRNAPSESVIPNPPKGPPGEVPATDRGEATEACDKPKVVSIQPKWDDKDRPVGHIRPFHAAEQNSTAVAVGRDETGQPNAVPGGDAAALPPKKVIPPPGPVSQTFNFVGKQVEVHISNNVAPFDFRRRAQRQADRVNSTNEDNLTPHSNGATGSYIIVGDDRSGPEFGEEYSDEDDCVGDLPGYSRVTFVGDNVLVGRSALIKTRNKKLKIAFDDQALSTYEYPSENSLLENEFHSDALGSVGGHRDEAYAPIKSQDTIKSTPGIGSTSGLGSYTPMAVGSAHAFKLGEMPAPNAPASNKTTQSPAKDETAEEDLFLKPAPDDENQVWSSAETLDILF